MERHSFVNLINVVHAELQLIERMAEVPGSLRSAIQLAEAASRAFKEARVARRHIAELARFGDLITADVEDAMRGAGELAEDEGVVEARAILNGVLWDAHLRVQEVIARHETPRPVRLYLREELAGQASKRGIAFACDEQELALPDGFHRVIEARGEGSVFPITELRITGQESLTVDLCGEAPEERIAVMTQNLRPSELQVALERGGRAFYSIALLHYLSLPGKGVTVEHSGTSFCASATFTHPGARNIQADRSTT